MTKGHLLRKIKDLKTVSHVNKALSLPLQKHKALTRKVVLKAGLCCNHPFGPGLTENGNGALWF